MAENYYKSVYTGKQIDDSLGRIINGELDKSVDAAAESAKQASVSANTAKENAEKTAADRAVVEGAADAERERVAAEETRDVNEEGRQEAELKRESDEHERVKAEEARSVWEKYAPKKDYVPGNKMTYGGSSYLCKYPMYGSTNIQSLLAGMTAYAKDNNDTAYFDGLTLDNINLDFKFYLISRGRVIPYSSLYEPLRRLKILSNVAFSFEGDYVDETGTLNLDWRQIQYYLISFSARDPKKALLPADSTELATSNLFWLLIAAKGDKGEKGDKGDTGETGPQGPQGPAGAGTGDMLASVYDPQKKEQDIFAYADEAKNQVVEQPDSPTSPNTILWVDTDAETPGVDIEGIKATAEGAKAEAELAHQTADGAVLSINKVSESVTALESKVDERFTEYDNTFVETGESITKIEGQIAAINVPNFSDSVNILPYFYVTTTSKRGSATVIGNMLYIAVTFTLTNPTTPGSNINICDFIIPDSYSFEGKYANFYVPYLDNGIIKTELIIYAKSARAISIFTNNIALEGGHEISVYAYIPLVPKVQP